MKALLPELKELKISLWKTIEQMAAYEKTYTYLRPDLFATTKFQESFENIGESF